jgi:hypothetical protein
MKSWTVPHGYFVNRRWKGKEEGKKGEKVVESR